MDEKHKSSLDALFETDKAAREDFAKKNEEAKATRNEFMEDFIKLRDSVCLKALQEFKEYIDGKGWKSEIEIKDALSAEYDSRHKQIKPPQTASIGLIFYRGEKSRLGLEGKSRILI